MSIKEIYEKWRDMVEINPNAFSGNGTAENFVNDMWTAIKAEAERSVNVPGYYFCEGDPDWDDKFDDNTWIKFKDLPLDWQEAIKRGNNGKD